jgi:hypothetical protein
MKQKGRAIAQAVSRRLPTAAARVQTRLWSCGDFVMDKSDAGAGFLRELWFPLPIYSSSASPQSSSLSPEAGTIGQEWPQCQWPHKPNNNNKWNRNNGGLVFQGPFFRILPRAPAIVTGDLRAFSQSFQANVRIVSRLCKRPLPSTTLQIHHFIRSTNRPESEVLYDWRFVANQFVLTTSPLRPTTSNFFPQVKTCGHSPCVTSSLTNGWVCRLKLLLVLASAVILRSESRGIHDHILLSQIPDCLNLEGEVPVFISLRKRMVQLQPQALGFLFVFYDSQGYGGGIRPCLHTRSIRSCIGLG